MVKDAGIWVSEPGFPSCNGRVNTSFTGVGKNQTEAREAWPCRAWAVGSPFWTASHTTLMGFRDSSPWPKEVAASGDGRRWTGGPCLKVPAALTLWPPLLGSYWPFPRESGGDEPRRLSSRLKDTRPGPGHRQPGPRALSPPPPAATVHVSVRFVTLGECGDPAARPLPIEGSCLLGAASADETWPW